MVNLIPQLTINVSELTLNAKTPTFDPFCYAPHILPSDIPSDFPREYRNQVQALLRHLPPTAVVSQLAMSHRDSNGQLQHDGPVLNRPWEWIENLGESATLEPKEEDKERDTGVQHPVKNSGSLSLDVFGARMTGDGILQGQPRDERTLANIRTFQDGLSADAMFKRDWRETRMEPDMAALVDPSMGRVRSETVTLGGGGSTHPIQGRLDKKSTTRTSPASSILSRTSAHGSTGSRRPSPGQSSLNRLSISTDTGDAESSTGSSSRKAGSKRKAPSSDDETLEGSSRSKKPKPKAVPVKTRAKKR